MTKPTFQVIGIWDGDSISQIIRHKDGNFYLLSFVDIAKPGYDNSIRLGKNTINGRRDGVFLTFDDAEFRKDLKTRYTLKPICRYEIENIDLSKFYEISEYEWPDEWFDEFEHDTEILDYSVEKND